MNEPIDITQFEGHTKRPLSMHRSGDYALVVGVFSDADVSLIAAAPQLLAELAATRKERDELKAELDKWRKEAQQGTAVGLAKCGNCGWAGLRAELRHAVSLTNADDWWECPECGKSAEGQPAPASHAERIVCPQCKAVQVATVAHGAYFDTRVHNCAGCGHVIMESEWENEEATP